MKFTKFLSSLAFVAVLTASMAAHAGGDELGVKKRKIQNLDALTATSVATGDFVVVYDASAGKTVKVDAGSYFAALAGYTGTAAELNYVDLTTLGTGAASKAIVLDASGDYTGPATLNFNVPSGGDVTLASGSTLDVAGTFEIANTAMTASAAELNYNDITTLGTAQASKVLTFDASLDAIVPSTGKITFQSGGNLTLNASSTFAIATTAAHTGDVTGDGGDQLYGFLQNQIATTTASATLANCGSTYVSDSTDVMTLPEASTVLGCQKTFVCGTADDLDINPADGTDQIGTVASITGANTTTVLAPSAGDAIRCTDIGSSITLEAVGANLWISVGNANGIWTDVN